MKAKIEKLLELLGNKCTKEIRAKVAEILGESYTPDKENPTLNRLADVIEYAIKVGGAPHGTCYRYPTRYRTQKNISVARVVDLYQIPEDLVNPEIPEIIESKEELRFSFIVEKTVIYRIKLNKGEELIIK